MACLTADLPFCQQNGNQATFLFSLLISPQTHRYSWVISSAALPLGSYSWAVLPTVSAWAKAARCCKVVGATSSPCTATALRTSASTCGALGGRAFRTT